MTDNEGIVDQVVFLAAAIVAIAPFIIPIALVAIADGGNREVHAGSGKASDG